MASNPQHEPTMEEILASIRKIISEDSNGSEAPAPQVEQKPAGAAVDLPVEMPVESDVLELTQEFHEEIVAPAMTPPAPEPVHMAAAAPPPEDDVVFQTIEEPVPSQEPNPDHEGIFSDKTRKAIDDAFAEIDSEPVVPQSQPAGPIAPVDGRTIEAVFERAVRESFNPVLQEWLQANAGGIVERMKPLIREWMDEHFPPLLEGAVRDEVARVAKARAAKR